MNRLACLPVLALSCFAVAGCGERENASDWKRAESGTREDLFGIWEAAETDVWAVGDKGTIRHFDGEGWKVVESNTSASLRDVWGSGPADVWAVGQVDDGEGKSGTILH
jgi:hypothetical protein